MGKLKGILAAAGAGAKKTLKSADVDALGNFKGKIQNAIDEIDNPKGGFEADVIPKAKKKTKKKKKLTAEQQKLKELEDAKKGAAEGISKTDDEIALSIATDELGGDLIGQQLKHAANTAPKPSKLKLGRAAKAKAKANKNRKKSIAPKHKPKKRGQDQYDQ